MVVVGVMLVAIGVPAIIMVAWSTVSVWVGEAVVESSLDVREDIDPIVPGVGCRCCCSRCDGTLSKSD